MHSDFEREINSERGARRAKIIARQTKIDTREIVETGAGVNPRRSNPVRNRDPEVCRGGPARGPGGPPAGPAGRPDPTGRSCEPLLPVPTRAPGGQRARGLGLSRRRTGLRLGKTPRRPCRHGHHHPWPRSFPVMVRVTGRALVHALGVAIFGKSCQFIVTWLIQATGSPIAPAHCVLACWLATALALRAAPGMRGRTLDCKQAQAAKEPSCS